MTKKSDLLYECNDQGKSSLEFESMFCNFCKNTRCVRAGWSKTSWEDRINTQVQRLILHPNIQLKESSSRWDGIVDFETNTVDPSWGSPQNIIITPTQHASMDKIPEISRISETPRIISSTPKRMMNTPASEIYIGEKTTKIEPEDPWAVGPSKVEVGGTFKMGKK